MDGNAFENAVIEGEGLRSVLQGVFDDIQRIILRQAITKPLANLVTGGLDDLLGFAHGGQWGS